MELLALRQALDGRDLAPLDEGGERQAGFHALAVHQHRAGAALAEAAAFLRAGEMQVLAQGIEQRGARIERQPMLGSVDAQHDIERSGRGASALRRRRRYGPRHELSSYKSAAGHRGHLQQLSSCHIGAGDRSDFLSLKALPCAALLCEQAQAPCAHRFRARAPPRLAAKIGMEL